MSTVLGVVRRSNQRGGRMLSVIDLLQAGTVDRGQLIWLLARILEGSSWLVGAKPGGAGKTTVMSALLLMLPPEEPIRLTNPGTHWRESAPGTCVVAYEISRGYYDAYIWGEAVCRLAELGEAGCRIVTNLHADTLEQARRQIVEGNGVPEEQFKAFELFIPIEMRGSFASRMRVIEGIQYVEDGAWHHFDAQSLIRGERGDVIDKFLDRCLEESIYTDAAVREAWLAWGDLHGLFDALKG